MYMATKPQPRTRKLRTWNWTSARLALLPNDGNRYEALDGALLVTPQARLRHQRVAFVLAGELERFCAAHELGIVVSPGAVRFGKNELQPDVQVIPVSNGFAFAEDWAAAPTPSLVVEILSTDSYRHDVVKKPSAYLGLGIPEYWVVDLDARVVLVFRPGTEEPARIETGLVWAPRPELPPLQIDMALLFGE